MNFTDAQINQVYDNLMHQLKLRIVGQFGSVQAFSKETGISRTTLVKNFSEVTQQDMSLGMYFRILLALGVIGDKDVNPRVLETKITVKEYALINNNVFMYSLTVINNDL